MDDANALITNWSPPTGVFNGFAWIANNGSAVTDSDGDGINDDIDNCPNNCNTEQLDADGDGIGDVCDEDDGCYSCGTTDPLCEVEC